MLKCRDVAELVNQSMDRPLPWGTRLGVWLHLRICMHCRRFARQMKALRGWLVGLREELSDGENLPRGLSADARNRIKQSLKS
jgi:hypothetical protein